MQKQNKILIFLISLATIYGTVVASFGFSQAQTTATTRQLIDISAFVVSDDNKTIPNREYEVRFTIYTKDRENKDPYPSNADAGSRIWEETQTVNFLDGILSCYLGAKNPLPDNINFSSQTYYLGIRIANDSEMVPRKKIGAVPSAIDSYFLRGAKTGTKEGDIPLIGAGGTIDKDLIPGDAAKILVSGSYDYLSASGVEITLGQIDLATDVVGILPVANGGTGVDNETDLEAEIAGYIYDANNTGGAWSYTANANDLDILTLRRSTDTSSAGNFLDLENAAGESLFTVDISGAVTSGAWNGEIIDIKYGGTGASNFTANYLLKGNGTGALLSSLIYDNGTNVGIGTASPGALLDIGSAGATLGVIRLEGSTSGYAALQPAAAAGNVTITLPATTGSIALGTGTNVYNAYWTGTNTLGSEQYVALTRGGTGTTLTASNGGIVYSNASTLAILGGTATASQILMSGASTAPSWSTATYPGSTTANYLLYSSSNNVVGQLTSSASSILVTNGSSVPAWATDIPTAVTTGGAYIYRIGGTDVAITDGGTGASNFTANYLLKGNGTGALLSSLIYDNGTNVGIGTASPDYKLDVQGGAVNAASGFYEAGVKITAASYWALSGTDIYKSNAGNVGIGDATPLSLLTVGNGDLFQVNASGNVTGGTYNGLTITNNGTNTLSITAGKTLSILKTMSFMAADDTGVYTLPTGTKTLLATDGNGSALTSLTAGNLSGTIPSAVLGNSTVYIGTTAIALNRASAAQALTGITSIDGNAATVTTNANLTGVITSIGNATSIASQTGTGTKFVVDTSPTLVTPILGAATAISINKITLTQPANGSTLTLIDGKTLTVSDSTTLATNAITLGGGEVVTFSPTNALSLLTAGATSVTLPTSGTLVSSVTTGNGVSATNTAGALAFTLGAITPMSVNGLTITANGTNTLSITAGKTLSILKTMSLTAADDTGVYTLPTGTATLARTDAGQTFTGTQTFLSTISGSINGNAATVTTNANLTGDVTSVGNATTLATVNSNTGSFGSSTSIPTFTVNGKGLITAASGNVVIAPAGTLTGTTLNATVVTSSLTTVGTLSSGAVPAALITAGTFGTGAYTFPSSLAMTGALTGVTTLATSGAINSQTISSAASFTGTVTAATSFLAPTWDTATGAAMNIGTATQTGLTLGRAGAATTINGSGLTFGATSWTVAPTISGLITATLGLTSNGTLTVGANQNLTMNSGTGLFAQTYTGTSDAMTLTSASTTDTKSTLKISQTGATAGTDYGLYVTNTGAGTTNVGGYFSATGAVTNNYGLIVAAGNVGIGSTTPAYKLDVQGGSVNASGGFYEAGTKITSGTYWTLSGSDLYNNNNGNVGIGTTAPNSLLTMVGGNAGDALRVYNTAEGSYFYAGARTDGKVQIGGYTGATGADLLLEPAGGNVGIGTVAPATKLEVLGTSPVLTLADNTIIGADNGASINLNGINHSNGTQQAIYARIKAGKDNASQNDYLGYLSFWTNPINNNANLAERMRITSGGNVGIGTTNPGGKFEVYGNPAAGTTSGDFLVDTANKIVYIGRLSGTSGDYTQFIIRNRWGSEQMKADMNSGITYFNVGNVGIGTTGPVQKLHLANAGTSYLHITNDTTGHLSTDGSDIGYFTGASDLLIVQRENNDIKFYTNGADAMIIKNSGNVGIGTTNPGYALVVNTSGQDRGVQISGDSWSQLQFVTSSTNDNNRNWAIVQGYTAFGNLEFRVSNAKNGNPWSAGTTAMTLDKSGNVSIPVGTLTVNGTGNSSIAGNVGIGTTAPGAKLEVAGSQGSIFVDANQFAVNRIPATGGVVDATKGSALLSLGTSASGGNIQFYTNAATGGSVTERMRITESGNVGIGTTSPARKLTLYGDPGAVDLTIQDSTTGALTTDGFQIQMRSASSMTYIGNMEAYGLQFFTGNDTKMTILSNGNVGIGTTGPSYQLQLSTDSAAKPTTNTWTVASDARLKNVVGTYDRGLNEIMQINPILYTYKKDNALNIVDPGTHIGIIAQDVKSVIPEAITLGPDGYYRYNADPLIWTAVNAIKEQQQILETHNLKLETQDTEIAGITLKIDESATTIEDLKKSLNDNLLLISGKLDDSDKATAKNIDKITALNGDISGISDKVSDLEKQIEEIRQLANAELNLAQIQANKTDIDYLKLLLGVDRTANPADIDILGKIKAEDIEALGIIQAKEISTEVLGITGEKMSGKDTIPAGETEIKITTPYASEKAKISITPKGSTSGKTLYIDSVKDGESFKVKIDEPAVEKDIDFDWFIIK